MTKTYTVVVVGGGIVGMSIAITLQSEGVPVLIIDKEKIGSGASWGNAGHIATEQVFPVADSRVLKNLPNMLFDPLGPLRIDWRYLPRLIPWGVRLLNNMRNENFSHIHSQLLNINSVSLKAWSNFAKRWDLDEWLKVNGSLLVSERESTNKKLNDHAKHLRSLGINNEWVTKSSLHEYEPALSNTQLGGIFFPDTGHIINIDRIFESLKIQFLNLGGKVIEHEELQVIKKVADNKLQLNCSTSMFIAEKVVLSCGAFSKGIVKMLSGISVPLETERGYHLMLPKEKGKLSIPVSSADRRFIMTPMETGLRLAGTVEYGGLDLPANMDRAHNLLPLANPMLKKHLKSEECSEWMGFRPTTSDSLPVIDRHENCFYAFGHQHLGLTQAAITAEIMKALFFDRKPPICIEGFSIKRFQ